MEQLLMEKSLAIFQLTNLAFFLAVFIGRTLYLWFTRGVNPFALWAGKKACHACSNYSYFPGWPFGCSH
jgi:hypothetical protein